MSTSHAYYTSGWCGSCGRKRGPDGRCENCDPWWSSPLIQYGAPLIAGVTLLLFIGTSLARQNLRGSDDANLPRTVFAPTTARPVAGGVRGYSANPGGFSAPPSAYGTPMQAATFGASIPVMNVSPSDARQPTPDQVRALRHEELRRMTAAVDATIRADDIAREYAANRSAQGGLGVSNGAVVASAQPAAF